MENGFKNFKLSSKTKTIIILIVLYFVLDTIIRNFRKQAVLDEAPNNLETTLAVRLYTAFHPMWEIEWLPDGTDEAEVIAVAKEMKRYKNYYAVSQKYRTIYNRDLTKDLSSEGVYNDFFNNYN